MRSRLLAVMAGAALPACHAIVPYAPAPSAADAKSSTPDGAADGGATGDAHDGGDAAAPETCPWPYRRKLSFELGAVVGPLDAFPVLLVLDAQRIDYARSGGRDDLRLTAANGVQVLPHEVQRWRAGGPSYVWVGVPRIDVTPDADHIWLYYGNPSASAVEDPAGVWSNGYLAVWHLDDVPQGFPAAFADSTGAHPLIPAAPIATDAIVAAQIGSGLRLDGNTDILTADLLPSAEYTLETWFNVTSFGVREHHLLEFEDTQFFIEENRQLEAGTGSEFDINAPTVLQPDTWYHAAYVQAASGWTIFQDGAAAAQGTQKTNPLTPLYVGDIYNSENYPTCCTIDGMLDEVRVSRVARQPSWIGAQHLSMTDAFVLYGPEQPTSADACPQR